MTITPYIAFDGNGREALNYYCDTLGAELEVAMSFGDMPGDNDWVTDENRDRLAHGAIKIGGQLIYASDTPGFEPHKGFSGITIHLAVKSPEEAKSQFDALARDGEIQMPLGPTFWSAAFGMLNDKYGVGWMVDAGSSED